MSTQQNIQKKWKLIELLNWSSDYLSTKGFENSRLNAECLLAHSLNLKRMEIYLNFDRPLNPEELAEYKILLKRRLAHEPLQYILGSTEFYSLPFIVEPGVLIPRPETEILVDNVLSLCQKNFATQPEIQILDVGCGSGNISVSLAKNLANAKVVSVDKSDKALEIAQKNAEINGVQNQVRFFKQDALGIWPETLKNFFDIVVSNPPYVSEPDYSNLADEIKIYEPKLALTAGQDGLDFYRSFSEILKGLLKNNSFAFFEMGDGQARSVGNIFTQKAFQELEIFKDLTGRDRIISILKTAKGEE